MHRCRETSFFNLFWDQHGIIFVIYACDIFFYEFSNIMTQFLHLSYLKITKRLVLCIRAHSFILMVVVLNRRRLCWFLLQFSFYDWTN